MLWENEKANRKRKQEIDFCGIVTSTAREVNKTNVKEELKFSVFQKYGYLVE